MVWQTKNKWYNIKPIKEAVSSLLLESEVLHAKANKILYWILYGVKDISLN